SIAVFKTVGKFILLTIGRKLTLTFFKDIYTPFFIFLIIICLEMFS
ncbi:MAG: hypothetical protein K0Q97_2544, partial [Bacillota bacterium]|nr:hypothetical protein [Bacillota bacterium]